MHGKYAILIDGGFIKKKLRKRTSHFPTVAEIEAEIARIRSDRNLADYVLLRVYFYDAPPASGVVTNPIDNATSDLAKHLITRPISAFSKHWSCSHIWR